MSSFSIRKKQLEIIQKMLSLNKQQDSKAYWQDVWKILIYDSYCRDILAPLMKVGELRQCGVTLHMLLDSDRQPIPDVPAVYFVMPTRENIQKICQDCANQIYDTFYLNFASSIPRPLLEELARKTVESDSVAHIAKVYDQYCAFVSLEDRLFTLQHSQSYVAFHDPTISDVQAEANVDFTVEALFDVVATLGVVPIIRCPKGDAAELIAKKLDAKIRDHLGTVGNLFTDTNSSLMSFQRPVLILFDRNIDQSVMLAHAWTYQALVHDLLGMKLNRVKVEVKETEGTGNLRSTGQIRSYDLDQNDSFWKEHTNTPFPQVAVEIKQKVSDYKSKLAEVPAANETKGSNSANNTNTFAADEDEEGRSVLAQTRGLGNIVTSLPELQEWKRLLDMHTNIALALLDQINKRSLDQFFALEEAILIKSNPNKKDILALLTGPKGTPEDKLRLFLIYYMCNVSKLQSTSGSQELKEMEEALTANGVDLKPYYYIKKIKAFDDNWAATLTTTPLSTSNSKQQNSLTKDFLKAFADLVSASVQYLVPQSKDFYVTRLVDAIMELKNILGVENYLYFDPKFPPNSAPRKNTPFREAIVFMIGGGNYMEYQNLQEYAKKSKQQKGTVVSKKIIYGASEILSATEFLAQLSLDRKSVV